jgi:hypothetical protein
MSSRTLSTVSVCWMSKSSLSGSWCVRLFRSVYTNICSGMPKMMFRLSSRGCNSRVRGWGPRGLAMHARATHPHLRFLARPVDLHRARTDAIVRSGTLIGVLDFHVEPSTP